MIEYMFSVCFGSSEPFDVLIREPGEPTKGELLAANDRPSELLSICVSCGMVQPSASPTSEITDT